MYTPASPCSRRFIFYLLASVLVFFVLATFLAPQDILHARFCSLALPQRIRNDACQSLADKNLHEPYSRTLGVASSIYVVSLARRTDRRSRMDVIREALGLRWQFSDALDKEDHLVDKILHSVHEIRTIGNDKTFRWPEIEAMVNGNVFSLDLIFPPTSSSSQLPGRFDLGTNPILCAVEDDTIPTYPNSSSIPLHLSLSRGMIACWYSHLKVIFEVARQSSTLDESDTAWDGKKGVAIVFEDDVDMEWDMQERLESMWDDLPFDWDIVFVGHCWSNEGFYPPLVPSSPLHPSHQPKCTHGYALSPMGARKLASYLSYPPFAFSRAIDQAIAHLVRTRRLRAFSVVPAIVKQQRCEDSAEHNKTESKCAEDSDIRLPAGMKGSWWRDILKDSVLGRVQIEKDMFRW